MNYQLYYKLNGQEVIPITDSEYFRLLMYRYTKLHEEGIDIFRVSKTIFEDCEVSTVFLPLDHGFMSEKPVVFETMVFGGDLDDYKERYCTWEEAVEGHGIISAKIVYLKIRSQLFNDFIAAMTLCIVAIITIIYFFTSH